MSPTFPTLSVSFQTFIHFFISISLVLRVTQLFVKVLSFKSFKNLRDLCHCLCLLGVNMCSFLFEWWRVFLLGVILLEGLLCWYEYFRVYEGQLRINNLFDDFNLIRLVLKIQHNLPRIIILTFKNHSDTGLLRVEEELFSFSTSDQTCRYLYDLRRPACSRAARHDSFHS